MTLGLIGRQGEIETLNRSLETATGGMSAVLVVRGEPGIGKTALVEHVIEARPDIHVARVKGIESEMEWPFAALHQMCGPFLDHIDLLPEPQRATLGTAFGLTTGDHPDPFRLGMAVLTLLTQISTDQGLVCLIDDAQWLDRASAMTLAFVARRLLADSVMMLFVTRERHEYFSDFPELVIEGLDDAHAEQVLSSAVPFVVDAHMRQQIIVALHGNPLALLELPRGLTPMQLAAGLVVPKSTSAWSQVEERYRQRLGLISEDARRLLLLAAAEPVGDRVMLTHAADILGLSPSSIDEVELEGWLIISADVTFRHPLARSVAYHSAPTAERRQAHAALAEVTDPRIDPDRRVWHLAQATSEANESVAQELRNSALRAQERGGLLAAAALMEQSAMFSTDSSLRVERMLSASQLNLQSGAFDDASRLVNAVTEIAIDETQKVQTELLRGLISYASNWGTEAPVLLLVAAKQLEQVDVARRRERPISMPWERRRSRAGPPRAPTCPRSVERYKALRNCRTLAHVIFCLTVMRFASQRDPPPLRPC